MRRAPFKDGDKIVVTTTRGIFAGTVRSVNEKEFSIDEPNVAKSYVVPWNHMHSWSPLEWKGPFNPEAPTDPLNPLDLFCLNCHHPVGIPVRPGKQDKPVLNDNEMMICIKCTEWMLTENGGLRLVTPQERTYMLLNRGAEMLRMLAVVCKAAEIDKLHKQ